MTGFYQYAAEPRPGAWKLTCDPATAMRARRVFARVQADRAGAIIVKHTPEIAADLEWFMERFPLEPADDKSAEMLQLEAQLHRDMEEKIREVLTATTHQETFTPDLMKTPRDYQVQAYQMLRTRRRMILGDELGLGKTFTALLGVIDENARPALVVPPTHLPHRWLDELGESLPMLTVEVAKKRVPPPHIMNGHLPDVLIVPYSKLDGWRYALAGKVRTVIFDEVQDLRRGTMTDKGTAAAQITSLADYVLGLSATPVYNYGGEVWNLYDIISPDALGTRYEFVREWGREVQNGHIHVKDPAALGQYLRTQGLLLARTRKDVGRELPPTIKVPHTVEADSAALDAISDDVTALAEKILSPATPREERWTAAGDLDWRLRQATGIAKAPYVAQFVRMLLEGEKKIALFGWHRAVYDLWLEALKEFKPVMYTGSETAAAKNKSLREFIHGDSRILIMSLRSGAGVDGLQKVCSVPVFGELDWSPEVHEQAIGRFRRDGMDEPVVAYFLTADEGSDPAILETLQIKRNQSEPIISNEGTLLERGSVDPNRARTLAQSVINRRRKK